MSLDPFFNTTFLIQSHIVVALIAVVLGPLVIFRQTRDRVHKTLGYVWVLAMLAVAGTGAFIPSAGLAVIGPLGPIHLFVLLTLWSVWTGMRAIYRRDIAAHRAALRGLYWQGLAIAGLLNFLPGRTINRMVFPDAPELGGIVIAFGGVALAAVFIRQTRARRREISA